MVVFLCIDYTIWPGWNHRGVYLYSRERDFKVGQEMIDVPVTASEIIIHRTS